MHLFAIFNFQNEKNKNDQSSLSCSGPASPSSCRVPRNGQICLDQRAQEQGDGWVEEVVRWNYSGDDKESGQSGQCGKLVRSPRRPVVPVLHAGRVCQRAAALEEDQGQGAGRHDSPRLFFACCWYFSTVFILNVRLVWWKRSTTTGCCWNISPPTSSSSWNISKCSNMPINQIMVRSHFPLVRTPHHAKQKCQKWNRFTESLI